jgi:hypothetical protein
MWLARDEDGLLNLFYDEEPTRKLYERVVVWDSPEGGIPIDRDKYKEVTFINSPVKVELVPQL